MSRGRFSWRLAIAALLVAPVFLVGPALAQSALAQSALAQSGPLQDPTGCATGSSVANCRNLPPLSSGGSSAGKLPKPGTSQGLSSGQRLRDSTPLPSRQIQRSPAPIPPPPASTGLGGGSTGLGQ